MKVHFIVNEQAGGHKGRAVWSKLQKEIGFPYQLFVTTGPLAATQYVDSIERLTDTQLIVVIGGDGTMHEVVNGAKGRDDLIVSFMKGGSGNDFARGIQCFQTYEEIVAFMQQEHSLKKWVDVATIESIHMQKSFVNNCGLGFDAYVSSLVNGSVLKKFLNKFHLGKLSYVYIMIKALFTYKPFQLEIEVDGHGIQRFNNVWFMTVSNQPYFGGGMKISPHSNIEDGQIELIVVNNLPKWKFLIVFLTVYKGAHLKYKEVVHTQFEQVRCIVSEPVHCHTDGESFFTPDRIYTIAVHRGQLIIPA